MTDGLSPRRKINEPYVHRESLLEEKPGTGDQYKTLIFSNMLRKKSVEVIQNPIFSRKQLIERKWRKE